MHAWLRVLAARSGWVAPSQLVNADGEPTDDARILDAARNGQSYEGDDARWLLEQQAADVLVALRSHTQCDASLYAAAHALLTDELTQTGLPEEEASAPAPA